VDLSFLSNRPFWTSELCPLFDGWRRSTLPSANSRQGTPLRVRRPNQDAPRSAATNRAILRYLFVFIYLFVR